MSDYELAFFDVARNQFHVSSDYNVSLKWHLNEVGDAEVEVPVSVLKSLYADAPQVARQLIRPGSYMLYRSQKFEGLRDGVWAGYLTPDVAWSQAAVNLKYSSIEGVFGRVRGPNESRTRTYSPGGHVNAMVMYINERDPRFGLRLGDIDTSGASFGYNYRYDDLLKRIKELLESGYEWQVRPTTEQDTIVFEVDFLPSIGREHAVTLEEVKHFNAQGNASLVLQGELINVMKAATTGSSWEERRTYEARNEASVLLYGVWEDFRTSDGNTAERLRNEAQYAVRWWGTPREAARITIVDRDAFKYCGLGDTFTIEFANVGLWPDGGLGAELVVRVVGRTWDEGAGGDGDLPVIVEVIDDGS